MNAYARATARAHRELLRLDAERETALRISRRLVRACAQLIRDLHRSTKNKTSWADAERDARALRSLLARRPEFRLHGAVEQALGEYAEAHLFRVVLAGARVPDHRRLRIPPTSWILGLADVVGELRRHVLDELIQGRLGPARHSFEQMEKVYEALVAFDLPEGLVPVKPKRDAARGLVEKTRGELVNAKRTKDLEKKIDGVRSLLDEAEGRLAKKKAKGSDMDLDLDKAWSKE